MKSIRGNEKDWEEYRNNQDQLPLFLPSGRGILKIKGL